MKSNKAMTLIELMLVVAIVGILIVAIQPYFYTLRRAWHHGDSKSDIVQNARIGLDTMVQELRQAQGFSSVTASTDANGRIVFMDKNSNTVEFLKYNDGTQNMLGYVQSSVTSPLAGPIDSLTFRCYTDDALTTTTSTDAIKSVAIELVVADSRGEIASMTFASRVLVRAETMIAGILIINEIMYNPLDSIAGNEDLYYEYIELYNVSSADINLSGWQFNAGGVSDTLVGDCIHGTGSTILPSGSYAVITDQDTKVYDGLPFYGWPHFGFPYFGWPYFGSPYFVPPEAIKLQVTSNTLGNGTLNNSIDTIIISDNTGIVIDSVTYHNSWGGTGNGKSLERISPTGLSNDPSNWEKSVLNGTPGSAN